MSTMTDYAIIDLRLSDFRAEDDADTFAAREAELRELAAGLGLDVLEVVIENDLRSDGRPKSASAFKTPRQVRTADGLITRRTNRPKWTKILVALQERRAAVLIAGSESRLARDWRDALDLVDVVEATGASVVVPDADTGQARWVLRNGGTNGERSKFLDQVNDNRKYSETVAANVTRGRRRWTGKSYQGEDAGSGSRSPGIPPSTNAP